MATITSLVDRVASLLDLTVDETSTPSASQVTEWLVEGFSKLVNMLPDEQLMYEATVATGMLSPSGIETTDCLKVLGVSVDGTPARKVPYQKIATMGSNQPARFSGVNFAYAIGAGNRVYVWPWSDSARSVEVHYIDEPSTNIGDNIAGLCVDYAVIMGKVQDEELEQSNGLLQAWFQNVQLAAGGTPINREGAL